VVNYNASEERAKGVKKRIEGLGSCRGVKVFVVKGVSILLSFMSPIGTELDVISERIS
jgi:hypothetical protein